MSPFHQILKHYTNGWQCSIKRA